MNKVINETNEIIDVNEKETKFVKDVYNKIAPHFNHTRVYKWAWINDFMNCYNSLDLVYDIGCGSGRNITPPKYCDKMLNNDFPKCIGIDNCREFINICREKNLDVIECDMLSLPFDDNTADGIISIASFHHLSTRDRRINALMEMKRVLKYSNMDNKNGINSGKILLSVWSINQPEKTRRKFKYGNTIVPWNNNGEVFDRYYYIFKNEEMIELFEYVGLRAERHFWDCGNEIYILTKNKI